VASRLTFGSDKTGWASTVWVDPGGTTGWGVISVDPTILLEPKPLYKNIAHWSCGDTHGNENQMTSEMLMLFDAWEDAAVGCEKFTVRKFLQHDEFLSPVRIRAKIEYGLWLMEKWDAEENDRPMGRGRHLFLQDPSMAKRTLTDDRQRDWGLWEPGKDHKRDAIKHCYTFLQRAQESPRLRGVAWPHLFKQDGSLFKKTPPTSKRSKY
jgi:hypothetical protein